MKFKDHTASRNQIVLATANGTGVVRRSAGVKIPYLGAEGEESPKFVIHPAAAVNCAVTDGPRGGILPAGERRGALLIVGPAGAQDCIRCQPSIREELHPDSRSDKKRRYVSGQVLVGRGDVTKRAGKKMNLRVDRRPTGCENTVAVIRLQGGAGTHSELRCAAAPLAANKSADGKTNFVFGNLRLRVSKRPAPQQDKED